MNNQLKNKQEYFSESQRFNNKLFIYGLLLAQLVAFYYAAIGFSEKHESTSMFWIPVFLPTVLIIIALSTKLETHIDKEAISYRWSLFQRSFSTVTWDKVSNAKVIIYDFVGYGLRFSLKYGTVHNVKGNKGLYIDLKNGKRKLIGTQKAEEMMGFLKNHIYEERTG